MRGGHLGRTEMWVVQMCTGVLQDPKPQCCFQWILAEFGGVEVGGDDCAHEFNARFAQRLRARNREQVGTRPEPAEVGGSYVCHRMTRAQGQRRDPPNRVVGQCQPVQRYAEEMLTDAVRKRQHVRPRGIVDNQFAWPYDRLAVALSDHAFARQLKPENDAGPQIVTGQLRGSLGGRMIGPHREDGQLPEISDGADRRRGAAVGGEGELHMNEGLRDRVTNGVGPVARRESAGIEKHRHCCTTHWPPVGSTAIYASQRVMYTGRSVLAFERTTLLTRCTPSGVLLV